MDGLTFEVLRLFPSEAGVRALEESTRQLTAVTRRIDDLGIARIDEKLIEDELWLIEIDEQHPTLASIGRGVNLAIKSADVQPVLIARIDCYGSNIAPVWTYHMPVAELCRISKHIAVGKYTGRNADPGENNDQKRSSETITSCGLDGHRIQCSCERGRIHGVNSVFRMMKSAKMFV